MTTSLRRTGGADKLIAKKMQDLAGWFLLSKLVSF